MKCKQIPFYRQILVVCAFWLSASNCSTTVAKDEVLPQKNVVRPEQSTQPLSAEFQKLILAGIKRQDDAPRYIVTEKVGLVDLAHVHEYIILTSLLSSIVPSKLKQAETQKHTFELRLRSPHTKNFTATTELLIDLNQRTDDNQINLIRDIAMTHGYYVELRQGDMMPPMFLSGSSFSAEDLQSNRIGIEIALHAVTNTTDLTSAIFDIFADLKPLITLKEKPKMASKSYTYLPYNRIQNLPKIFEYRPQLTSNRDSIRGIETTRSYWQWDVEPNHNAIVE